MPAEPLQLARERSHEDARTANENARAASQATIIINGGAATAIIAFISRNASAQPSLSVHSLSWALMGYAMGTLCGALMTFCIMKYLQIWSEYWTEVANERGGETTSALHGHGLRWMRRAQLCFSLGMALFAISSFAVALSIVAG